MASLLGPTNWPKNTSLDFHPVFLVKVWANPDGALLDATPGLDGPAAVSDSDGGDGKPAMGWALGLLSMAVGEDGAGKSLAGGGG